MGGESWTCDLECQSRIPFPCPSRGADAHLPSSFHRYTLQLPTTAPTQSPTAIYRVDTTAATAVGYKNSSTLNGVYQFWPPSTTVVYYYKWAPCNTFNTSTSQTPNATFTASATGNGSIPGYVLTGLQADVTYCFQSCAVSPSTKPNLAVCGDIESFQWTTAVGGGDGLGSHGPKAASDGPHAL